MEISSFRDLRVWQAAMDLVEQVYELTKPFPRHELYGLAGQMQRAAVSIPANVSEGHNRFRSKEFLHHLLIAEGSLAELETRIGIAMRLKYVTPDQTRQVLEQAASLGRQLVTLRKSLSRRISSNGSAGRA